MSNWGVAMLLGLVMGLGGCGSVELRQLPGQPFRMEAHATVAEPTRQALARSPDCCRSLRELPYRNLDLGGKLSVVLDASSPAHAFDSGKSYFAAFRLTDLPRPARIEVMSYRSAEPGSVLQQMAVDLRQTVLQPTVLLLNANFEEVRRLDAATPRPDCAVSWAQPAFELPLWLTESPQEVAYLVLLSASESMQRESQSVCGVIRHGMSPVGEMQIHTRILPLKDPPLRMALPVRWYPDARRLQDASFWQEFTAETRMLALGRQGLQILDIEDRQYRPVLEIPYARLARASVAPAPAHGLALSLTAVLPGPGQSEVLRQHTLRDISSSEEGAADLNQAAEFLATQITPGRAMQMIDWRVLPEAPALQVEGSASGIGQSAALGGVVVASPCGLCQMGGCTPEMLGTCAALFGVGAMLGGASELVKQAFSGKPAAPDTRAQALALQGTDPGFSPSRLTQCLAAELQRRQGAPWQDGGLSARSVLATGASGAGSGAAAPVPDFGVPDFLSEVSLRRLILTQRPVAQFKTDLDPSLREKPAHRQALPDSWHLDIHAQVRLTERTTGRQDTRLVEWSSAAHPLADWTRADSPLLPRITTEACEQLPRSLLNAAEYSWQGR